MTPSYVFTAQEWLPNSDPVDGLISGTVRALDVPLITRDALMQELRGLKCVW